MPMGRWRKAVLSGIVTVVACLAALAWWNAREEEVLREDLKRDTEVVAHQAAGRMRQALEQHRIGAQQMANFWKNSEEVTEEEFQHFAEDTLKLTPLCLRIVHVDPSFHVRRVHPLEPNRGMIGFNIRTHVEGHQTLLRAIQEKQPVLSPPLELLEDGGQGFVLAAPIFKWREYLGAIVCTFRSSEFFKSLVLPEVTARYEERVFDEGVPLFATSAVVLPGFPPGLVTERFNVAGQRWELRIAPREEVTQARLRSGFVTFWVLGTLLSLVAGAAVSLAVHRAEGTALRLRTGKEVLQATRARLDDAMKQLLQAEKMTALGELVAGVAHELNNPLTSVLGYSQLALSRNPSSEIRRFLETACSEAERAGKIVRNLLAFARKQPPEKKYLGLNGIIEKTLELKAYHFRSNQIEVEKDLDPQLPMTLIDFHQMQQVLLNLLNNAEQAMQEAGRGGRIRVATRRQGERIEARITDSGPGIPDEILYRIFEPFFTTKKEGRGTGLGLSLCYGIVQEHGGSIRVESGGERGATFVIDLPILRDDSRPERGAGAEAGRPPREVLRVLVIDDEASVQNILVEVLGNMGYKADTASDVPEALRKIQANRYDLFITDMRMPRGTGKDVYEAVREKSPELTRRVIFTTGDGASVETQAFLKETGNEILLKPWSLQEFEQVVGRAMSKKGTG